MVERDQSTRQELAVRVERIDQRQPGWRACGDVGIEVIADREIAKFERPFGFQSCETGAMPGQKRVVIAEQMREAGVEKTGLWREAAYAQRGVSIH